jgi:hypothetical protein
MNLLECYVTNITYIGERNEYNCHKIVADLIVMETYKNNKQNGCIIQR